MEFLTPNYHKALMFIITSPCFIKNIPSISVGCHGSGVCRKPQITLMNGDLRISCNRGWSGSASITKRWYTPTATSVVCVWPRIQKDTAALFPDFTPQSTTTSQHPSVFTSCGYCPLPYLMLIYLQCKCSFHMKCRPIYVGRSNVHYHHRETIMAEDTKFFCVI